MAFFTYTMAGVGFILIGAWEALTSSNSPLNPNQSSFSSSTSASILTSTQASSSRAKKNQFYSSLTFISVSVLSFLFILNSMVSFVYAFNSGDKVGSALQLQVLAISSLFLLYSITGFSVNFTNSIPLPYSILSLIGVFAFVEEFLLFYLQRKDPSGIENRYFDLLLVPITVCLFSTVMELRFPTSNYPKLARGVGLILQGTWFVQMGLSFYTNLITSGCSLHEKSRGNYTLKCKGHPEYHRARAIATLQFNCHLALLVVTIVGVYSLFVRKYGIPGNFTQYKPLSAEMQQFENAQFTLDSDDDVGEEIKEEDKWGQQKVGVVESGANGYGTHK
ncbi:hypothetical protein I3843_03G029800 [Carya illinoinensis]|uniref:Uncharacterized protein n=1 Tax=Carya illinoinensis TaxID=32201 RepID=A0A8T1QZ69_CARIL|nr:uncharacterized protein LOC122302530 [Carya illinoinensis]KAG2714440.1 hypothetical protein I3760_03G026700 [Carya illinoinensis]KAG6659423.1 hypothetical protein CIPAW_03G033700 [Carya illinoinensis]KAG6719867.1 hypothetical protein I3842_03G028300 [Carya illinoinensis]KAG7985524.1 hypothetical protein I3843_03G029800 [Carya illinoinensis]